MRSSKWAYFSQSSRWNNKMLKTNHHLDEHGTPKNWVVWTMIFLFRGTESGPSATFTAPTSECLREDVNNRSEKLAVNRARSISVSLGFSSIGVRRVIPWLAYVLKNHGDRKFPKQDCSLKKHQDGNGKSTIFNRKYMFKWWIFQAAMLVYGGSRLEIPPWK